MITTALDRSAMRSACRSVLPSPDGSPHGEEAFEFLHSHDFFAPAVAPANLEILSSDSFQFDSPAPSGVQENDIVRGRFARAGADWQHKPSVILLHGWNAELQYRWMLPFWSELLAREGINAFSFELPYHSSRRPQRPGTIRNFLSGNLLHFLRATNQTLADTRALAAWLRQRGCPSVGLWGTSLGAWLTGLAISHQPEFASAVMLTPVSRMDRALCDMPFGDFMRSHANDFATTFSMLNLASHRPLCVPSQVLIVASEHDLFAPAETVTELAEAWHPEVWRYAHGHITILMASRIMRRIAGWCAEKLGAAGREARAA